MTPSGTPAPGDPVKKLEVLKAVGDLKPDDQPDVLLAQAVQITADLAGRSAPPTLATAAAR